MTNEEADNLIKKIKQLEPLNNKDCPEWVINVIRGVEYCTPSENMKHAAKLGLTKTRHIAMVDGSTGNDIMQFHSIEDAQRYFGREKGTNIENCLNGRSKTAYGYKWRYVNEKIPDER